MAYYLIDFENVKSRGMEGEELLAAEDTVCIFYSDNADSMTFDLHRKLNETKAHIIYHKVAVGTKNALDFQLATYLGYLVCEQQREDVHPNYYIVTKDNGFSSLVVYWRAHQVPVRIIRNLLWGRNANAAQNTPAEELTEGFEEELDELEEMVQSELPETDSTADEEQPENDDTLAETVEVAETEELIETEEVSLEDTVTENVSASGEKTGVEKAPESIAVAVTAAEPAADAESVPPAVTEENVEAAQDKLESEKKEQEKKKTTRRTTRKKSTAKKDKEAAKDAEPEKTVNPEKPVKSAPEADELTLAVEKVLSDKEIVPQVVKFIRQYKTKQGINNALNKEFKDSKRTSEIYSAIKPLIADKKGK